MTLMVPSNCVELSGSFSSIGEKFYQEAEVIDKCPVPLLEASAIIGMEYVHAMPIDYPNFLNCADRMGPVANSPLGSFAHDIVRAFSGKDGIYAFDRHWRHAQIYLSEGCEPSRIFIGENGIRFAFTPDFLDGVL